MEASRALAHARRKAGLTQRELARRSGVAQPAIARIESGRVEPRVGTMGRLVRACGQSLEVEPRLGTGVDRTVIRELLELTPGERLRLATEEAMNLRRLLEAGRRK